MPTYTFRKRGTEAEWTMELTMAQRELYLQTNPDVEQLIVAAPGLVDPIGIGRKKPDDGFRDVLREIKRKHRGSNVNTFD